MPNLPAKGLWVFERAQSAPSDPPFKVIEVDFTAKTGSVELGGLKGNLTNIVLADPEQFTASYKIGVDQSGKIDGVMSSNGELWLVVTNERGRAIAYVFVAPVQAASRVSRAAVLDALGISSLLWSNACMTALARHTDTVSASPSALLKAAEWYEWGTNVSFFGAPAIYRKLHYGTTDTGSFDMLDVSTDMAAVVKTRDELYENMCANTFTYMKRGPLLFKTYLDSIAQSTEGQRTSLQQFFGAVRRTNNEITDKIDLLRRRTYATRVACEVAMVALGAATIPLLIQIGVGVGYALITQGITHWADMEQADIVAMPKRFFAAQGANISANVAQEGTDRMAQWMQTFDRHRQRALQGQEAEMQARLARILERAGGRGRLVGADKVAVAKLEKEIAEVSAKRMTSSASNYITRASAKAHIRVAGVAVGLYFMRQDIENVITMYRMDEL